MSPAKSTRHNKRRQEKQPLRLLCLLPLLVDNCRNLPASAPSVRHDATIGSVQPATIDATRRTWVAAADSRHVTRYRRLCAGIKAARLASCARQAEDGTMLNVAQRIEAKAIRREGDLLKQIVLDNGPVGRNRTARSPLAPASASLQAPPQPGPLGRVGFPARRYPLAVSRRPTLDGYTLCRPSQIAHQCASNTRNEAPRSLWFLVPII